jgi:hypothetical protein
MPQDYEFGYTIAPPTPSTRDNSEWGAIYKDFLENGVDNSRYLPGGGATAPTQQFTGGGVVTPPAEAVGEPAQTSTRDPNQQAGGNAGEQALRNQNAGSPIRDIPQPAPGVNPVDAGQEFMSRLNKEFPEGLKGSDPSKLEQFLAENGVLAVSALGWLSGIPGMGWLAKKVQDWYWRTHQWQSPIPDDAPQPGLGPVTNDEMYPPQQSPIEPMQYRRLGSSPFYGTPTGPSGRTYYDRWGNRGPLRGGAGGANDYTIPVKPVVDDK